MGNKSKIKHSTTLTSDYTTTNAWALVGSATTGYLRLTCRKSGAYTIYVRLETIEDATETTNISVKINGVYVPYRQLEKGSTGGNYQSQTFIIPSYYIKKNEVIAVYALYTTAATVIKGNMTGYFGSIIEMIEN